MHCREFYYAVIDLDEELFGTSQESNQCLRFTGVSKRLPLLPTKLIVAL
jgi:hypothetical protein